MSRSLERPKIVAISQWLETLGLRRYADAFADNDIDFELLQDLTADDLKELGVNSLGHRKKILTAAGLLQQRDTETPLSDKLAKIRSEGPKSEQKEVSERRQVTVLFADLVAYTSLSQSLGDEDIHLFLSRYFEIVDTIIRRHGGTVDKHIGDCVMAIFGAPLAHSNDAERAVRAAIEIHASVAPLEKDFEPFGGVHIGIASGQVVASRLGSTVHQEYTVTGDSVNLASRLTSEAKAAQTLVSDTVYSQLTDKLQCTSAGLLRIKGFAEPVRAWRLDGLRSNRNRRSFVGRGGELAQWRNIVGDCSRTGHGSVVFVRGHAGIGKTALVEEFQEEAQRKGFDCHTGLVLDFGTESDQDAIPSLVRSLIGVATDASADDTADVVARVMASGMVSGDDRIYLNAILGLPQSSASRTLYDAMDNATRINGMRATVEKLIQCSSSKKPLVLVVEDVHWADQSTLGYLVTLAVTAARCPAIVIMTSRIEGDPLDEDWRARITDCPLVTIDVGPLQDQDARQFADTYQEASQELVALCVERAEGNPLFLEQLLRHARESGSPVIPGSIQSIVQARVDSLEPEDRTALQAATVLGQRFSLASLRYLIEQPEYTCDRLVTQLLVRPLGDEFLFSHALIRDGIYDSILSARRRPLHGRAAAWFDGGDLALKAEHLERAEDLQAANAYLSAANQQAGLYRFDRALALVYRAQTLSSEPAVLFELTRLEGDLLRELGSTSASIDACGRALNCAHTEPQICRAKIGLVAAMRVADRLDEALTLLDEAESVARANSLDAELSEIHYYRGSLFFPQGNLEGCLEQHELALDSATRAQLPERQTLALSGLGDAYYAQGRMRTAHQVFRRCLDLCHTHGFGRVEAANLFMLGTVRIYLNELDDALDDALRSAEVASRVGHKRAEIVSRLTAGWVLISMAKVDAAREQVERGLELADTIGAQRFTPFLSESLARIVLLKGSHAEAVRILEAALATARDLDLMTFIGPWVLGTLAETTAKPTRRQETLQEGHLLLSKGCVGHNYYRFYQSAVEASLHAGSWDDADRYAAALADYTKHEPVPWSDFYIERGFALAEHGRGVRSEKLRTTLKRLRDRADQVGLRMALPALDMALQQPWPRSIHTRVE